MARRTPKPRRPKARRRNPAEVVAAPATATAPVVLVAKPAKDTGVPLWGWGLAGLAAIVVYKALTPIDVPVPVVTSQPPGTLPAPETITLDDGDISQRHDVVPHEPVPTRHPVQVVSHASDRIQERLRDSDEAKLVWYAQALVHRYVPNSPEPTGQRDDVHEAALRRVIETALHRQGATPSTWDGNVDPPALIALRKDLSNYDPHRVLMALPDPTLAGQIYAAAVLLDPEALNVFDLRHNASGA